MNEFLYFGKIVLIAGAVIGIVAVAIRIGEWKGKLDSDRTDFKKFIEEVRKDIKEILLRLSPAVTDKSSPLKLTDLGRSISDRLKASEWAKETAPSIIDQVTGKHPYEIQNFCLDYATKGVRLTPSMDQQIKSCAYENGITKRQVLEVLAIELRDELIGTLVEIKKMDNKPKIPDMSEVNFDIRLKVLLGLPTPTAKEEAEDDTAPPPTESVLIGRLFA